MACRNKKSTCFRKVFENRKLTKKRDAKLILFSNFELVLAFFVSSCFRGKSLTLICRYGNSKFPCYFLKRSIKMNETKSMAISDTKLNDFQTINTKQAFLFFVFG